MKTGSTGNATDFFKKHDSLNFLRHQKSLGEMCSSVTFNFDLLNSNFENCLNLKINTNKKVIKYLGGVKWRE